MCTVKLYDQLGISAAPVAHAASLLWPWRKFTRCPRHDRRALSAPLLSCLTKKTFMERLVAKTESHLRPGTDKGREGGGSAAFAAAAGC
jgi:hypothetical protein